METFECRKCKQVLPASEYYKEQFQLKLKTCKTCRSKESRAYYAKQFPGCKPQNNFSAVPMNCLRTGKQNIPIRNSKPDGIVIYQLVFKDKLTEDRVTYVGQTSQSMQRRLTGHARGDSSEKVKQLIPYLKEIRLHELCQSREEAWEEEKQLARGLRAQGWRVLNKEFTPLGFHAYGGINRKKVKGKLRCRICKEWVPREQFCKDKSRSSGRSNQCKKCYSNIAKILYRLKKHGYEMSKNPQVWAKYLELKGKITMDDIDFETLTSGRE